MVTSFSLLISHPSLTRSVSLVYLFACMHPKSELGSTLRTIKLSPCDLPEGLQFQSNSGPVRPLKEVHWLVAMREMPKGYCSSNGNVKEMKVGHLGTQFKSWEQYNMYQLLFNCC